MNENRHTPKCPRCGTELAADAPEGLCPRCLLALNLAPQTEITGEEVGANGTKVVKPPPPPTPPPEEIARLFPQFEILECLGRGGMGAVYKARQPKLDRCVALKILLPERHSGGQFAERFAREARALARLNHPAIVAVHDFGEAGGYPYLVMEYVDGLSLRQLLQRGKLAPEEALVIVPRICEALQFAHQQGIVHRDIKPENILLDQQGQVKIADFGIAKILAPGAQDFSLTGGKDVVGTPHYMAPEQIEQPAKVDHRADIFSLGVVFYEMLTGELPLGKFQPPSHKVQVDVRLDEVLLHALEKEPERRYQHASQVKTDLETIAGSAPSPQQTASARTAELERGRWLVIAASFILFLAGVAMGFRSPPQFGIPIVLWGLAGFVIATAKAIRSGGTPEQDLQVVRSARKVLLVDGIGVCLAGLYVASRFPGLDAPFGIFLAAACCSGVVVCVLRLCGIEPLQAWLAPRAGSAQPAVVHVQLANHPRGARIGLALIVLSGLVLLALALRECNRRTPEPPAASVEPESPAAAVSSPTPVAVVPSPPVTPPPSAPLQPLLARVAALPPLTPGQIESYVEQNKRTAESLLAAFRMGGDLTYLTEAANRFPADPDVQYAVIAARAFPELQRQWVDAYQTSSPDNALAWYFSTLDYFKAGDGGKALQELAEATRKPAFRAELAPTLQAVEELEISAGRVADEARVAAFQACAQVPHLGPMRELAQAMQTAAEEFRQRGDAASAESLTGAGLLLGGHLSAGGGSQTLINQLVGISIEKRFLQLLDPTRDQDPFGRPLADVRAAIERHQALLKECAQSMAGLMFGLEDTELANYMERVKLHGEEAALAWLKAKHGQP
jgi:tRNA A-37 threonylcarbamoyl transferase component Bud32